MKPIHLALIAFAALPLGCGKGSSDSSSSSSSGGSSSSAPAYRHISGGAEQSFHGVIFDIPSNWKSQVQQDKLVIAPDGANASGLVEEVYIFGADASIKSLDGPDFERNIGELVGTGATKKSGPESRKFGELDGRVWIYTTPAQNGKDAEIRIYACVASECCALVAVGLPEALSKRSADIDSILASMHKSAAAPAGASAPAGGSTVRPELVGEWIWITNFSANAGGSSTSTRIFLNANGSYRWKYERESSNPNGAAWTSENESGTWTATDNTITWVSAGGRTTTQKLEKRNHPKNTGDPMIVLDGKCYVTAKLKNPW